MKDHNDIHLLKFSGGFVAYVSVRTRIAYSSDDAYLWQGWAVLLQVELRLCGDWSNQTKSGASLPETDVLSVCASQPHF
jgi:hypothetical protein